MRITALLFVLIMLTACGGQSDNAPKAEASPTPKDPRLTSALDESVTQDEEDPKARLKVREIVTEKAGEQFPGWKVEGVSALAYTGTLYIAGVDLSCGNDRRTVNYVVRMFVAPDNRPYWKIDEMTKDLSQALSGWTYLQLQKARRENEKLESDHEDAKGDR